MKYPEQLHKTPVGKVLKQEISDETLVWNAETKVGGSRSQ
jgi:hypothetical protein